MDTMKSKIKAMLEEERGVSPVIGVILMVAITVILAAVIGTFVLGLGDNLQQAPQSSVSVSDASADYSGSATQSFVISHQQGDALTMGDMRIVVRNASDSSQVASYQGTDTAIELNGNADPSSGTEFGVGDSIVINETSGTFDSGYKYNVQLIHVPSDSTVTSAEVTLN